MRRQEMLGMSPMCLETQQLRPTVPTALRVTDSPRSSRSIPSEEDLTTVEEQQLEMR